MWKIVQILPQHKKKLRHREIKSELQNSSVSRKNLKLKKRPEKNRRMTRLLRVTRKEKRTNNNINQLVRFSTKEIKNHIEIKNGKNKIKDGINNIDINKYIKANVK
jgi:hypothetical protein